MNSTYRFDEETIVYDILQKEAVLVNLDSGHYYILDELATVIWMALKAGSGADEVERSLLAAYDAPPEAVKADVEELLAEFVREGIFLVVPVGESPGASGIQGEARVLAQPPPVRRAYRKPAISKFTDMEYAIAMCPVWDYDETGWPKRRSNPPVSKK